MAKKKTVWKTAASTKLNRSPLEVITEALDEIAQGKHRCLRDEEALYNELGLALDRIEKLPENWERLAALESFLATDTTVLKDGDAVDTFQDLYEDAASLFVEYAKDLSEGLDITPEDYISDILASLAHGYAGPGGREALLAQADSVLPVALVKELCEKLLAEAAALPEIPDWVEAVQPLADAVQDPELYERSVLAIEPEPSHGKILEIANAYLLAEKADKALEWIGKVENPDDHDREEKMDLHVGCLVQQGKKGEAVLIARVLYNDFPNAFNLARLCQLVTPAESEPLLDAFAEKLEPGIDADYAHLLLSLERKERLEAYLAAQRMAPAHESPEDLEALAERFADAGHEEWAAWVRKA